MEYSEFIKEELPCMVFIPEIEIGGADVMGRTKMYLTLGYSCCSDRTPTKAGVFFNDG